MASATKVRSNASTASGRTYFDADPRRRADSVITDDDIAPNRNAAHNDPKTMTPPRAPSAVDLASDVTLPVMLETNSPPKLYRTTLVYPPTHERLIASRDF